MDHLSLLKRYRLSHVNHAFHWKQENNLFKHQEVFKGIKVKESLSCGKIKVKCFFLKFSLNFAGTVYNTNY